MDCDGVRLQDIVPWLVDSRVGIIRTVREYHREAGTPDFFHYVGEACDSSAFTRQSNFRISGGAASDRDRAIGKAIGEAVERYCAAIYDLEEMPLCSANHLPSECVSAEEFALYSRAQYDQIDFPWRPFTPSTEVRWTKSQDARTGACVFVPAAMVYLPYTYFLNTGDTPICQPISTGLACHTTWNGAILSAVCEVVERDAFTITWQAALDPPQIQVATLSEANFDLVMRFERALGQVVVFDITTDTGIPTVLSVNRSRGASDPPLSFAAAADPSPEVAVRKSLEELAHTLRYMRTITQRLPRLDRVAGFVNVVDQVTHLNFWCDKASVPLADFLFASRRRLDFQDMHSLDRGSAQKTLEEVLERIGATGSRTLIVDVTSPDVRQLGLHVVRAIVPGFHPLFMGHWLRALGGNRLWQVPQRLGYRDRPRETVGNPAPHPYP